MPCTKITQKKYLTRKSPAYHAGDCKGLVKKGKDGMYVSKPDARGIYKWVLKTVKKSKTSRRNNTVKQNVFEATTEKLKKICNKYNVTFSGSKQKIAEGLWRIRGSLIDNKDLQKIIPLLPRDMKKRAKNTLTEHVHKPIITNYKGMWKEMPKPLGSMKRDELVKHLKGFRNAWEKITTRDQDLSDEHIHSQTNAQLRQRLMFYFSNDAKLIAEDWLR
jgi:hypothetical protein